MVQVYRTLERGEDAEQVRPPCVYVRMRVQVQVQGCVCVCVCVRECEKSFVIVVSTSHTPRLDCTATQSLGWIDAQLRILVH